MRIAIIGSGISGLTSAYYLQKQGHDVFVFEASDYIGGHTNTVNVSRAGQNYAIDTGFIVFNHQTYPNFTHLLNELHVDIKNTEMSFSVYDPKLVQILELLVLGLQQGMNLQATQPKIASGMWLLEEEEQFP